MSYINAQNGNTTVATALYKVSDGTANIALQTNGANALVINNLQNPTCSSAGAIQVPSGTTAQRPTAANGMLRYNSDTYALEAYVNGSWVRLAANGPAYTVSYLMVAGGGGAGSYYAGAGGGAGGMLSGTTGLTPGTKYTATVGGGGAGAATLYTVPGDNGTNSSFTGLTSTVGGGGGGSNLNQAGVSGGSGGGEAGTGSGSYPGPGSGTSGQGNRGGYHNQNPPNYGSGGGGGAGGVGGDGTDSVGGNGGVGLTNPIIGSTAGQNVSSVYYLAGGGSGGSFGANGSGGLGGGGGTNGNGTANTGGGGGGNSGNGGLGVIVLSIPTTKYSGSYTGANVVITTSGSNTIVSFYSSGTYTA